MIINPRISIINMQSNQLYTIESERKIAGRLFEKSARSKNCNCSISDQTTSCSCPMSTSVPHGPTEEISEYIEHLRLNSEQGVHHSEVKLQKNDTQRLGSDTSFMTQNRTGLNRFEPLSVGDNTLTGISIGGYDIDLTAAAQKAREVLPLPPSKLPIIFLDQELNFYHHFFQGLEFIFGKDIMSEVTTIGYASEYLGNIVCHGITKMIDNGYEKGDGEILIFIKKTMTSTFEIQNFRSSKESQPKLTVVANLWGFQYIEAGMQCGSIDLCMWLAMCYGHYKTLWFNTFKMTGVPDFAQLTRGNGEPRHYRETRLSSIIEHTQQGDDETIAESSGRFKTIDADRQSVTSRRSKRSSRHKNQVTRWIASN